MKTFVTIKMEPESVEELQSTFGSEAHATVAVYEQMHKDGVFGPFEQVDMRYLIIGGKALEEQLERQNSEPPTVSSVSVREVEAEPQN